MPSCILQAIVSRRLLCLENHMRHSAQEDPEKPRHRVVDLIGIQAKCCYAMPAPNGSIRAKSVTVQARASRIRAKVDMIDGMMCREFVSVNGSWLDQCCTTGVQYGGKEEGCGDRYIQMTDSRWAFSRFSPRPKTTWIGYVCGRFAQNTP